MTIAEKLIQIAENELKVYEAGKQSVGESYETFVFTQDCTNALQALNILSATMSPADKIVMFVNKAWTGFPTADTVNNKGLWMMCLSKEFSRNDVKSGMIGRWRDGGYYTYQSVNASLDYVVSTGEEWLKVVLL